MPNNNDTDPVKSSEFISKEDLTTLIKAKFDDLFDEIEKKDDQELNQKVVDAVVNIDAKILEQLPADTQNEINDAKRKFGSILERTGKDLLQDVAALGWDLIPGGNGIGDTKREALVDKLSDNTQELAEFVTNQLVTGDAKEVSLDLVKTAYPEMVNKLLGDADKDISVDAKSIAQKDVTAQGIELRIQEVNTESMTDTSDITDKEKGLTKAQAEAVYNKYITAAIENHSDKVVDKLRNFESVDDKGTVTKTDLTVLADANKDKTITKEELQNVALVVFNKPLVEYLDEQVKETGNPLTVDNIVSALNKEFAVQGQDALTAKDIINTTVVKPKVVEGSVGNDVQKNNVDLGKTAILNDDQAQQVYTQMFREAVKNNFPEVVTALKTAEIKKAKEENREPSALLGKLTPEMVKAMESMILAGVSEEIDATLKKDSKERTLANVEELANKALGLSGDKAISYNASVEKNGKEKAARPALDFSSLKLSSEEVIKVEVDARIEKDADGNTRKNAAEEMELYKDQVNAVRDVKKGVATSFDELEITKNQATAYFEQQTAKISDNDKLDYLKENVTKFSEDQKKLIDPELLSLLETGDKPEEFRKREGRDLREQQTATAFTKITNTEFEKTFENDLSRTTFADVNTQLEALNKGAGETGTVSEQTKAIITNTISTADLNKQGLVEASKGQEVNAYLDAQRAALGLNAKEGEDTRTPEEKLEAARNTALMNADIAGNSRALQQAENLVGNKVEAWVNDPAVSQDLLFVLNAAKGEGEEKETLESVKEKMIALDDMALAMLRPELKGEEVLTASKISEAILSADPKGQGSIAQGMIMNAQKRWTEELSGKDNPKTGEKYTKEEIENKIFGETKYDKDGTITSLDEKSLLGQYVEKNFKFSEEELKAVAFGEKDDGKLAAYEQSLQQKDADAKKIATQSALSGWLDSVFGDNPMIGMIVGLLMSIAPDFVTGIAGNFVDVNQEVDKQVAAEFGTEGTKGFRDLAENTATVKIDYSDKPNIAAMQGIDLGDAVSGLKGVKTEATVKGANEESVEENVTLKGGVTGGVDTDQIGKMEVSSATISGKKVEENLEEKNEQTIK